MFKSPVETLLDIIYPKNCIFCKKGIFDEGNDSYICQECFENIAKNLPPFCLKCGRHLESIDNTEGICQNCLKENFNFDCAWSVCFFDGIIKDLIHKFKYSNKTLLAKSFARLFFDFIMNFNIPISIYDIMLPVPLHKTRLREREYNQSELLAKELRKFFPLEASKDNVIRIRNTKSQTNLDKTMRRKNTLGAFKVINTDVFKEKNILIIDDLLTTGATTSELAKTLKESGAKKVSVLTLAIAK